MRRWMRRIGPGQAVGLSLLAVVIVGISGVWANHGVRTSRIRATASGVLRQGMTRSEAERALSGVGLPLNYPGTGIERSRGFSITPLGFTALPLPGSRYAELDVYFVEDRVSHWEVVTESEWL